MSEQLQFLPDEELDMMSGMQASTNTNKATGAAPAPAPQKRTDNQDKETLVLPVAGKPTNGTIFPHEEKLVWKEMSRVIDEMVYNMSKQGGFRLLVPIWNKFDLEFLRYAEKYSVPVTFVLPMKTWGDHRLPKFQTDLVVRMKNRSGNTIHIHSGKSFTERVHQAIRMSDITLGLHGSVELDQFYPTINETNTRAENFPINRMRYTNEEQAIAFEQRQVENSALAQQDAESLLQFDA